MACLSLNFGLVDAVMEHRQDRLWVVTENLEEIANGDFRLFGVRGAQAGHWSYSRKLI